MNRRYPRYPDDSDYQTNAPSYYEDLARKNKLLEMLAKKIWEYDERLDGRLEDLENVLQDYLSQWDERIDNLDDEVSHIFVKWLHDGTLEQIINHDVLGNKADKDYVDKLNENITSQLTKTNVRLNQMKLNVLDYGALGDGITDDTISIQKALDELVEQGGGTLYFPAGTYLVTKPLLMKSNALTGGYDFPPYKMEGQTNRETIILKENETKYKDINATVIMIHASLDFDRSTTSHQFENITISNNSDGEKTYGVYSNKTSRTIVKH